MGELAILSSVVAVTALRSAVGPAGVELVGVVPWWSAMLVSAQLVD